MSPDEPPVASVSVVVPAHNAAKTLPQTLDSLRQQTLRSWECVVVDDGSTDDTRTLAARRAREDQRIRCVSGARCGPGAARNVGARLSRASVILFLDADDLIRAGHLATLVAALEAHPAHDVAYTATAEFHGAPRHDATDEPVVADGGALASRLLAGEYLLGISPGAALVRRVAFERVGGFREDDPLVEDIDLWARLAHAGAAFTYVPGGGHLRRMAEGTRSRDTLTFNAGLYRTARWLHSRRASIPVALHARLVANLRYRALVVAGLHAGRGAWGASRRWACASLRWARSPGAAVESLRLCVAPRGATALLPEPE